MRAHIISILLLLLPLSLANAEEADVVAVEVNKTGDSTYRFNVTVTHNDEGWIHYANKWEIVGPDGTIFGTRTLHHPHINEQPFTRSLSGVKIPEEVRSVTVRAHDLVHEHGGKVVTTKLP